MFNMQSEQLNLPEDNTIADLVTSKQLIAIQSAQSYRSIDVERRCTPIRQLLHS
jgi:hypothetical protein